MPLITPEQFTLLLPLACAWAEEQEHLILQNGIPLSAAELADGKRIGLCHPEQVRVQAVESIPMPGHPALKMAAEATGLLSPLTAGLTLRYGVFIRLDCWNQRRIRVHELAHVVAGIVVNFHYGWGDGHHEIPWTEPNLMLSAFWTAATILCITCYFLGARRFRSRLIALA